MAKRTKKRRPPAPRAPKRRAATAQRQAAPATEADRLLDRAIARHRSGDLAAATAGYAEVMLRAPNHPTAYTNFAVARRAQGHFDAAVAACRRALALDPDNAPLWSNLGNALRSQLRYEAAELALRRALELDPDYHTAAYNLGLVLRDLGRYDDALAAMRRARDGGHLSDELEWDWALTLLISGDLAAGFEAYEARWKLPEAGRVTFAQPWWDGAPAPGATVLLHAEQGLGDTLQFVRYAAAVKRAVGASGQVLVECQPQLARLVATVPGVDRVIARGAEPLPAFDVHAPMLSLPRLLGTDLGSIPAEVPYVTAAPADPPGALPGARDAFRVGIVWGGKPSHRNDRNRSCPVRHFLQLAAVPRVALYSLQFGPRSEELAAAGGTGLVRELGDRLGDFAQTAGLVAQFDLVVTIDTAMAHLAGALGAPVWVALSRSADWRWLAARDDSPWYPSMRLFRQSVAGDWDELFDRLTAALGDLVGAAPVTIDRG